MIKIKIFYYKNIIYISFPTILSDSTLSTSKSRLERENTTINTMIQMYCKKCHKANEILCQDCSDLFKYAEERLRNCRFGEEKPTCDACIVHCYKPDMREKIRTVMRYAGPRMIYTHPIMGFRHLLKKTKKKDNSDE
ncbi:MAG: nitrous oxide-stimulated promoter family protein [Candidatus Lokiarchaeota archaeon]|nr:nitrous oxide-stimulated promoter family protein [Candidatus Lokiarchaeota archaeon]